MLNDALTALVTLLVVVDPIGIAPAFLAVTDNRPPHERNEIGMRAAFIATAILAGTALAGSWLLDRLGIGLPAFRISGGILLFAIAFDMVLGWRPARETRQAEDAVAEHVRDVAAFPLAIPLIAGPGAITATLLLAGKAATPTAHAILIAIIAVAGLVCALTFMAAVRVSRALGVTGNVVLSRLLGIVLAALAVQFILDGAHSAFS